MKYAESQTIDGSRLLVEESILDARQNTATAPTSRKQSIRDEKTGVLYVNIIAIAEAIDRI